VDYDYDTWQYEADEAVCDCLSEYSFLYSCSAKVLEISKCSGTKGELEQMEHFLEKLSCFELVKVCADETHPKRRPRFVTDL
ncbi:unnamed protein product, partial [Arabidopsis halleri]